MKLNAFSTLKVITLELRRAVLKTRNFLSFFVCLFIYLFGSTGLKCTTYTKVLVVQQEFSNALKVLLYVKFTSLVFSNDNIGLYHVINSGGRLSRTTKYFCREL